jgi:hypothetical protein
MTSDTSRIASSNSCTHRKKEILLNFAVATVDRLEKLSEKSLLISVLVFLYIKYDENYHFYNHLFNSLLNEKFWHKNPELSFL